VLPRVRVDAQRTAGQWVFSVADDGPGVRAQDRERVFEPFTSLPAPRGGGGHGLGLATCRRIVDRHGGAIWMDETPGGGATVRFTLAAPAPA
jgi:signal transduction histidine kinase